MTKARLFIYMCELQTAVVMCSATPTVYRTSMLSQFFGESRKHMYEMMKELEADELVYKNHYGYKDDDGKMHCFHGWSLTEKARRTITYSSCLHEALERYEKIMHDMKKWERLKHERNDVKW